jgi:hypothetical protein
VLCHAVPTEIPEDPYIESTGYWQDISVDQSDDDVWKTTDMGWGVYPEGMRKMLNYIQVGDCCCWGTQWLCTCVCVCGGGAGGRGVIPGGGGEGAGGRGQGVWDGIQGGGVWPCMSAAGGSGDPKEEARRQEVEGEVCIEICIYVAVVGRQGALHCTACTAHYMV